MNSRTHWCSSSFGLNSNYISPQSSGDSQHIRKPLRFDANSSLQPNWDLHFCGGVCDLWRRACIMANVSGDHLQDIRAKSLTDTKRLGLDTPHLAGHATEAKTVRYLRNRKRDFVIDPRFFWEK